MRCASELGRARRCRAWPQISADQLQVVAEPIPRIADLGSRTTPGNVVPALRAAAMGPRLRRWSPPHWLFAHQVVAAQRVAAALTAFRGAILADAVGFGKTYVSLAISSRYRRTVAVVPAAIVSQWKRTAHRLRTSVHVVSAESLSRTQSVPAGDLLIVDEAHWFRNPQTRRYDRLARGLGNRHLLLVTATPVVNHGADLVHLLRLFLPDNGLAMLGVRSLEDTLEKKEFSELVYAMAPLVVARSTQTIPQVGSCIPSADDVAVVRASPVDQSRLNVLLSLIDELTFPGFGSDNATALMRTHAAHRLASSAAALRETIRRHVLYVDRARAACGRGERIGRSVARQLFGTEEEFQLELLGSVDHSSRTAINPAQLDAERTRLQRLLEAIPRHDAPGPKVTQLRNLLRVRHGKKTIVFTTAIATALDLARQLGWRELAAVAGGRAWIASGRISLENALSLFAPHARGFAPPPPSTQVRVLIATDLASEGLDLQDADAIVHFDLPWTPVRLSQRLGRVARLGSPHERVQVWWFVPPPLLAQRMGLEHRIAQKAHLQLHLGVATTSSVGRAQITNALMESRHRFVEDAPDSRHTAPGYAVVRTPRLAAFALCWSFPDYEIAELLVLRGNPLRRLTEFPEVWSAVQALRRGEHTQADPPPVLLMSLRQVIRARLSALQRGARNASARALARCVLRRARRAGQRRALHELRLLDTVLDRLRHGLSVGAERELSDALSQTNLVRLKKWIGRHPARRIGLPEWRLDAALLGDDSVT